MASFLIVLNYGNEKMEDERGLKEVENGLMNIWINIMIFGILSYFLENMKN